jgi:group I intron endonuclease
VEGILGVMLKMPNRTGVYKIRNLVDGKVYVGSASLSFKGRESSHFSELKKGTHYNYYLQRAWNKYGQLNFVFEIIEECVPSLCLDCEQYWIDELKSANPEFGYNLSPTAGNCLGVRHTEETKRKVGSRSKEAWKKKGFKERMSQIRKEIWKDLRAMYLRCIREGLNQPEVKEKLKAINREITNRPEVKDKIRKNSIEISQRPGVNERRRQAMKKHLSSPEARAKQVSHLNTPENKAKQAKAMKDPITRAKISKSRRIYFENPDNLERFKLALRKSREGIK